MKLSFTLLCTILIFINCFNQAYGEPADTTKKWNFLAEPYLMFPHMKGDIGAGDQVTVPVDANTGEILGKLKMGAMFYPGGSDFKMGNNIRFPVHETEPGSNSFNTFKLR